MYVCMYVCIYVYTYIYIANMVFGVGESISDIRFDVR